MRFYVGNGQAEPAHLARQVHAQPARHAVGKCRDDDLVEAAPAHRVLDRRERIGAAHLPGDLETPAASLSEGRASASAASASLQPATSGSTTRCSPWGIAGTTR